MATELVTAREMADLVTPVRVLLRKNKKIDAIRLVRERMDCGLNESKEFVEHVESWPAARAQKVAELWIGVTSVEAAADESKSEPRPTSRSLSRPR